MTDELVELDPHQALMVELEELRHDIGELDSNLTARIDSVDTSVASVETSVRLLGPQFYEVVDTIHNKLDEMLAVFSNDSENQATSTSAMNPNPQPKE